MLLESIDVVCYGSYNLNSRSHLHDFELNIAIRSNSVAREVRKLMNQDILISNLETEESLKRNIIEQGIDRAKDAQALEYFS